MCMRSELILPWGSRLEIASILQGCCCRWDLYLHVLQFHLNLRDLLDVLFLFLLQLFDRLAPFDKGQQGFDVGSQIVAKNKTRLLLALGRASGQPIVLWLT